MEYSVLLYYPNIIGIYKLFYIKRLHYIFTFSHLKFAARSLTLVFVHYVKSMLRHLCLYDKL